MCKPASIQTFSFSVSFSVLTATNTLQMPRNKKVKPAAHINHRGQCIICEKTFFNDRQITLRRKLHKNLRYVLLDSKKKAAIIREYRKILKKGGKSSGKNAASSAETHPPAGSYRGGFPVTKSSEKMPIFKRALVEFTKKQSFEEERKQQKQRAIQEKEEAFKKYRKKKQEKFKKLSQKTKWGQPAMNPRIELLLEKIQKSISK